MSASKILLALLVIAFGIYCSKQSKSESGFPSSTSFQPEQKEQKTQSGKCFEGSNGPRNVALDELEDDDYYGILDLKDDASMEEIRLAFRRLSRLHHPDKNLDDQEGATKRFAKVNQAYETLSDEDSRAMYDSERTLKKSEASATTNSSYSRHNASSEEESSLFGNWFSPFRRAASDDNTPGHHDHDGCAGCLFRARWGVCSTHLQLFSLPGLYSGLDDSPTGFFTLYRCVFDELIVQDECKFTDRSPATFPSFGYSTWPYNAPFAKISKRNKKKGKGPKLLKNDAKSFYDFWTTFSSQKDFGWAKVVDLDGMPDSGMKRWLKKENKMSEGIARNDYNDTIRKLARYVRKIDPRCR